MIVLVDNDRKHLWLPLGVKPLGIDLVAPQICLLRRLNAAWVDHDLVEAPEVGNAILNASWPLLGPVDVKAVAPDMTNRLRP